MIIRIKSLLIMLFAMASLTASAEVRETTVSATYTYYGEGSDTPDDCRRRALEGAKLQAIAQEFGTVLTQDVVQHDVLSDQGESTYFSALNATEVKGEWIADEGEPKFDVSLDADGHMVVRCTVKGRARSVSNEAVEFETLVLRNGTDRKHADTAFRSDDRMMLLFKAPVDGYVSVFLVGQDRSTYALLPYMLDPNGEVRVKRGREYIFFDKSKADKSYDVAVDELKLTADLPREYYRVYVVFSPNRFSGPLRDFVDNSTPETLTFDSLNHWLARSRHNDPRMNVKIINLTVSQ